MWFIILVLALLLLIYILLCRSSADDLYLSLDNDNDIEGGIRYINTATKSARKPIDNFRIAETYEYILKDKEKSYKFYNKALGGIDINNPEDRFVRDKIANKMNMEATEAPAMQWHPYPGERLDIRIYFGGVEIHPQEYNDLVFPPDDAEWNIVEGALHQIMNPPVHAPDVDMKEIIIPRDMFVALNEETKNIRNLVMETLKEQLRMRRRAGRESLENLIVWVSDGQNVHDSNISNEYKQSFEKLRSDGIFLYNIDDVINYIENVYDPDEQEKKYVHDALEMLEYIRTSNVHIMKLNCTETMFISVVFSKIMSMDEKMQKTILENFIMNLCECYKRGTPVCVTGRVARILSSFATIEGLGDFKSLPVIKNEILAKAAAIRNRNFESLPLDVQEKYNKGQTDQDTETFIQNTYDDIERAVMEYNLDVPNKNFLSEILMEIKDSL